MGEWKTIEPEVWKAENSGDSIEGILINKRPSPKYDNKIYNIETANGEQKVVFGTTVLDDRMDYVEIGTRVRITYKGTEKNKKDQDVKIFKVEAQEKIKKAEHVN